MGRIRSVHPDICESTSLAAISASAERTFVRLWTVCDDEGRAKADPRLLKAKLYPLHDDVEPCHVEADLDELEKADSIQRYTVDGTLYLAVRPESWHKFQHPNKPTPSKLPPPPEECGRATGVSREPSTDSRGVDVDGEVDGDVSRRARERRPPRLSAPPTALGITDDMRRFAVTHGLANLDLAEETARFLDHHRAKGTRMADW